MGEEDDQSNKDDHNFGSPLAGQEEGVLAGLLMDLVRHKDKSKAYLIIDEFMTRMKKMEKKIRELSEGRGSRKKEENFREAVREAVAKEVEQAVGGLREEIREIGRALKKGGSQAVGSDPGPRTWAEVVAREPPKKVIPGRLGKEVLVRGTTEAALARRSPQEIVQAVNGASEKKGAVAASKLPSGDVVVTFQDGRTKDWHVSEENSRWIGKAFGEGAREGKRTLMVLVKGVLKRDLKDTTEDDFGQSLGLSSVERAKFRIPTTEGVIRATILVTLTSQEEAKRVYDEGVVWRA